MPPVTAAPPGHARALRLVAHAALALLALRVAYHLAYLAEHPMALGTFSDGRVYEAAAWDIGRRPPLGTQPFYLQGLYAYQLAFGMLLGENPGRWLLVQLAIAGFGLFLFWKAASGAFGRLEGAVSAVILLASTTLAFYENKFLSASLGVVLNIASLWAFTRYWQAPSGRRAVLAGVCAGLAVLGRPNLVLALPFLLWGMDLARRRAAGGAPPVSGRLRTAAAVALGLALALAPMAARNLAVTGSASVFPAHGGGTSFYIGNNPASQGTWNGAGVLTGDLALEPAEFAAALGLPDDRSPAGVAALGRALYARGFEFIAEDPVRWVRLLLRKIWLTVGADELTQDYSIPGERLWLPWAHRLGLPFPAYLALGLLGVAALRRRAGAASFSPILVVAAGQLLATLAPCAIYFTSAQHRLPALVPLAFVAGPGLVGAVEAIRAGRRPWALAAACAVLLAQGAVPRLKNADAVPPAYLYNAAVTLHQVGEYDQALEVVRAAEAGAQNAPLFRLEEARLLRLMERFDESEAVIVAALGAPDVPPSVRKLLVAERGAVEAGRAVMAPAPPR